MKEYCCLRDRSRQRVSTASAPPRNCVFLFLLPPWASSTERKLVNQILETQKTRRRREAGNAQQVCTASSFTLYPRSQISQIPLSSSSGSKHGSLSSLQRPFYQLFLLLASCLRPLGVFSFGARPKFRRSSSTTQNARNSNPQLLTKACRLLIYRRANTPTTSSHRTAAPNHPPHAMLSLITPAIAQSPTSSTRGNASWSLTSLQILSTLSSCTTSSPISTKTIVVMSRVSILISSKGRMSARRPWRAATVNLLPPSMARLSTPVG